MDSLHDKVFSKLTTEEKLTYGSLIENVENFSNESLLARFFEILLEQGVVKIINLDNGNISKVKVEPTVQILFLRLNGIKVLSGSLRNFDGHLYLENCQDLERIDHNFMFGGELLSVEFDNCPKLSAIGTDVFRDCRSLTSVKCSSWVNLRTIADNFMCGCRSLTSINCSTWINLRLIGIGFMGECESLTFANCSHWVNLEAIDKLFMSGCRSLTFIDCSNWTRLTTIGHSFMGDCRSLTSIDCSNWGSLTTIEHGFMTGCNSLSYIIIPINGQYVFMDRRVISDIVVSKMVPYDQIMRSLSN